MSVMALAGVIGQQHLYATNMQQSDEDNGLEWMQHCNPDAQINGTGARDGSEYGAAVMFSKEFLKDYNGKEISAVAIALRYAWNNLTLYIREGDDISTATEIHKQSIDKLGYGWNYIKLDKTIRINSDKGLSIEYRGNSYEGCVGFDGSQMAEKGTFFIYKAGKYTDSYYYGTVLIRALVGGDPEQLANFVTPSKVEGLDGEVSAGSTMEAKLKMQNNSFSEVSSVSISYTYNGETVTEDVTYDTPIKPYSEFEHTLSIKADKFNGEQTITIEVTKVNGQPNTSDKVLEKKFIIAGGLDADDLVWVEHCDPKGEITGIGDSKGEEFRAAARFNNDILGKFIGNELSGAAIALTDRWENVTLAIKKGESIEKAEDVSTQVIPYMSKGWNYVKIGNPVEIVAGENLYVEFRGKCYGTIVGIETVNKAEKECSYMYTLGNYTDVSTANLGNIMIRALVNGNTERLSNMVTLNSVEGIPATASANTDIDVILNMQNNSYDKVSEITVSYIAGSDVKTENVTLEPAIEPFSTFSHKITVNTGKMNREISLSFSVPNVNGAENEIKGLISQTMTITEGEDYGKMEWIQYCDPTVGIAGMGGEDGTETGAAIRFSKEFLADHVDKEISAVAIGLNTDWKELTLIVKKGDDIATAADILTQEIKHLGAGWNYVKLEHPIKIEGDEAISIFYKAVCHGYNVGLDLSSGLKAEEGCSYKYSKGTFTDLSKMKIGNVMIRALVSGNPDNLASCVALSEINGVPEYTPQNSNFETEFVMNNNSFSPVTDIEIAYTIGEETKTEMVKFDTPIEPYSPFRYTMPIQIGTEDVELTFSIAKVNGKENIMPKTIKKSVMVYEEGTEGERVILIEKFTGQACSICPSGEKYIQAAIKGQEERVARIDHHYGYKEDIFTIEASKKLGQFFGVNGAPQCMMDRTIPEDGDSPIFHPAQLTGTQVFQELQKPVLVSLNIKTTYNESTRELTVNIEGTSDVDIKDKRISVVLTQSGYVAYQAYGGEDYVHNDFPIVYLTEYNGDAVTMNNDKTYNMNFECTIPESISNDNGNITVDLSKLKIVAFISSWNGKEKSEVMNAAFINFDPKISVDITPATTPSFTVRDGKVVAGAECQSLRVYSLNGMEVKNDRLPAGIYIVKAICNGDTYTGKVAMR